VGSDVPTVYLVGAGPGDPGLVTVRAVACLRQAEVVIYDHLANPRLLDEAPLDAERTYVGKQAGSHALPQGRINALLVRLAREGKRVVRLKGGDPFVFGRGGEEALALADAGVPFEIVPGVTAGVAAPAYAGIPVTHRGLAADVTFVTGHEDPAKPGSDVDWPALARLPGTLVVYMGMGRLGEIADALTAAGKPADTPTAVVRWGTTAHQQTVTGTLGTIADEVRQQGLRPPGVVVVGAVATLRDRLSWFERRPLLGQTVVVTRTRQQASELAERLEALGADVRILPTIRIEDPEDFDPLDEALRDAGTFDWIVFTSVNGVERVFDRLWQRGGDVRDLKGVKLAAIGPATAEALQSRGLRVECVPELYRAEAVVEAFGRLGETADTRFLLPRADIARPALVDGLRQLGAEVVAVDAYRTVLEAEPDPELLADLADGQVDWVTLTSSSTARNFARLVGERLEHIGAGVRFASIGPITTQTALEVGLRVAVEAKAYTIDGLVDAMVEACTSPTA